MEAILEPLLRSPRFPRLVDELNQTLRREAEARERFRQNLDEDVREEFINGEVISLMSSREKHTIVLSYLVALISLFVRSRRLGAVRAEQALTGFSRNDYAPDICFWVKDKAASFQATTTIYPVPDFICEVLSPSTEGRDRGVKFEDYALHRVAEYWIVDADGGVIEQYILAGNQYELAGKVTEGIIRSKVIAGFEMPVAAAFDEEANLVAVRSLMA